ncbi:uncharacterized protein LOC120328199 [Styela clava]
MLFDEEDWKDDNRGIDLKTSLFDGRHDTAIDLKQINTVPNRRKRKKVKKSSCSVKSVIPTTECSEFSPKNVELSKSPPEIHHVRKVKSRKRKKRDPCNTLQNQNLLLNNLKDVDEESSNKKDTLRTTTPLIVPDKMDRKRRKLSEMLGIGLVKFEKPCKERSSSRFQQNQLKPVTSNTKSEPHSTAIDKRSDDLRNTVTSKLESSQFRFINEQLYTRTSKDAKQLFTSDVKSFQSYHAGFKKQVSKWPVNPLDLIINYLKKRPSDWVIGDFGCGDARLAASIKNKVYSFDLVAVNTRVTVADISQVPLPNGSIDVAVLCLSLMGTNYVEFLMEANRTLRHKGVLKIAEVASRFTNISKFVMLMKKLGFELERQDRENSHFSMFDFRKIKSPQSHIKPSSEILKPCVYKKR